MFGVSIPELLIVFVIVLLVLGPEKLPKAAQTIGKILGAFRQQTDAVRRDFYNAVYPPAEELTQTFKETKRDLHAVAKQLGGEEYLTCEEQEELQKQRSEKERDEPESLENESESPDKLDSKSDE